MSQRSHAPKTRPNVRERVYRVIFHSDTFSEKLFDVLLIAAISLSVGAVMLESVAEIRQRHGLTLYRIEWVFTIVFTIEYVTRICVSPKPSHYMRSPLG